MWWNSIVRCLYKSWIEEGLDFQGIGGSSVLHTMCKVEGYEDKRRGYREGCEMGFKFSSEVMVGKSKTFMVLRPRMKLWLIRVITTMLLCACVLHLVTLGEMWGPRLLKVWPCFTHSELPMHVELPSDPIKLASPPKSEFWASHYNQSCYLYHFYLLWLTVMLVMMFPV